MEGDGDPGKDPTHRSDALFFKAFQESPNGIALLSADGQFHRVNPTLCRILGYSNEELTRLSFKELTHPEDLEANLADVMKLKRREIDSMEVEKRYRHKQGHWVPTFLRTSLVFGPDGEPEMYVSHIRNLTELKKAEQASREREARLKQAERLEGLGLLAGGVAHDFNNLLASVIGNADLALSKMPPDCPIRENIQAVLLASRRATELCNQLMTYTGKNTVASQSIQLPQLVEEILGFLKVTVPQNLNIRSTSEENLPRLEGDITQVRQVVMNLLTNAIEAVSTVEDGAVSVEIGSCSKVYDTSIGHHNGSPGPFIFLAVSDTGVGMSDETQARIFDPFFTTKFTGRGLGLAAVRGIVLSHGGSLGVQSKLAEGTTITVYFPAADATLSPPTEKPQSTEQWTMGEGLVLLVDDDELVIDVAEKILRRAGYDVVCAIDGGSAIDIYRKRHQDLKAMVLDITMPGLNGFETYALMRDISDRVPVLFSSGYANDDIMTDIQALGCGKFIQKPYRASNFLTELSNIISSNRT